MTISTYRIKCVPSAAALLLFTATAMTLPCRAQTDAPGQTSSQAPSGPPPGADGPRRGGPERRVEMLQRQLSLTPDQTTQVRALMATERSKMEALHANSSLSQGDMHTQMMAIHQDSDTKLRALLTPDQATKYDAMQAQMRARMQERGGDGQGPPPPSAPQL